MQVSKVCTSAPGGNDERAKGYVKFRAALSFCENCSFGLKDLGAAPAVCEIALPLAGHFSGMKKIHIVLLLFVVSGIVGMSFFVKDLTTQETFKTAQKKKDKYVVIKVTLDKETPIMYDPVKDPNLTVFYALDADGNRRKVVYNNAKITDMERSEGLDLNGYMRDDHFECNKIQAKCPSKYKDDLNAAEQNISAAATTY